MDVSAYQDVGTEIAVVRRKTFRDRQDVVGSIDADGDIKVGGRLTLGFYVGGSDRGYDVRVAVTRDDLLRLLKQLDEFEEDQREQIDRRAAALRLQRRAAIIEEAKHQEALARRRVRDRRRRAATKRQGKAIGRPPVRSIQQLDTSGNPRRLTLRGTQAPEIL